MIQFEFQSGDLARKNMENNLLMTSLHAVSAYASGQRRPASGVAAVAAKAWQHAPTCRFSRQRPQFFWTKIKHE